MSTLRVVLDSNVVISGFLFGGPPAGILEYALSGSIRCFTSLAILDEIRDVLRRPKFGLSPEQSLAFIEAFHDLCEVVQPSRRVRAIKADPADNAILECGLAASADVIVSGDVHLLELARWRGIRILSPALFITEFESPPMR